MLLIVNLFVKNKAACYERPHFGLIAREHVEERGVATVEPYISFDMSFVLKNEKIGCFCTGGFTCNDNGKASTRAGLDQHKIHTRARVAFRGRKKEFLLHGQPPHGYD